MNNLYFSFCRLIVAVLLTIIFASESSIGQTLRISDDIGGGGNSAESSDETDNTFIYVAAAVVIGGLIAYALLRDKKPETEETDTTSVGSTEIEELLTVEDNTNQSEITEEKIELPVNLFFGTKREDKFIPERTFFVGLSVKF